MTATFVWIAATSPEGAPCRCQIILLGHSRMTGQISGGSEKVERVTLKPLALIQIVVAGVPFPETCPELEGAASLTPVTLQPVKPRTGAGLFPSASIFSTLWIVSWLTPAMVASSFSVSYNLSDF